MSPKNLKSEVATEAGYKQLPNNVRLHCSITRMLGNRFRQNLKIPQFQPLQTAQDQLRRNHNRFDEESIWKPRQHKWLVWLTILELISMWLYGTFPS